jgi:ribosomal protein S18 acetylase RimI-like enzyme
MARTTTADTELLGRIDAYLDRVPRAASTPETVGPFTLFVGQEGGWQYYARPTPGTSTVSAADVASVRSRQRDLRLPEAIEWIEDLVPGLSSAAEDTGLAVRDHPLMSLAAEDFRPTADVEGFDLRLITPDDDVPSFQAVATIGFGEPGTEVGSAGVEALAEVKLAVPPGMVSFVRDRLVRGLTVTAAAFRKGVPVAVGSHQPLDGATEVVGVATLPAFRRRGLGGAVTSLLVEDALERGVGTVFLSAGDGTIARTYSRLGFRVIGTAGAAEPPGV